MSVQSACYAGAVMHRRMRPSSHQLRYRVSWLLLDLDELDSMDRGLRFFSRNGFNLVSFHDRDFGAGSDEPLRSQVEQHLRRAGVSIDGGAIRLLCMPRLIGYAFNPLSIFFCFRRDGGLAALIYEVHNTFGERHSYIIPVDAHDKSADEVTQHCDKCFYVSPFIAMDMAYELRVTRPGKRLSVVIRTSDKDGLLLVASLAGGRQPLTDTTLLRGIVANPMLTLKVVGAIHWHALRLWWKGIPLQPRPPAPKSPVSIVHAKA